MRACKFGRWTGTPGPCQPPSPSCRTSLYSRRRPSRRPCRPGPPLTGRPGQGYALVPTAGAVCAYGWPWGLWQRALKPKFACDSCRAPIAFSRLTKAAQAQVTRRMRTAFAGWIIVVVFVILGIASPFLVALAYR